MKPATAEEHQRITCLSIHQRQKELLKVQNTVIALKLLEEPAGANQRQAKKGLSTADFWVKGGMQDHFLRQTPGGEKVVFCLHLKKLQTNIKQITSVEYSII